jgi:hypothetical protein
LLKAFAVTASGRGGEVTRAGERTMRVGRQASGWFRLWVVVAALLAPVGPRPARAVEVGEPAPDFTLASTAGGDISLRDFRGKRWVLLEFYGADFVPT